MIIAGAFFTALLISAAGQAGEPYFATIRAEEANARTGPGVRYPIRWQYRSPGLPVRVDRRWHNWRLIVDPDGDGGWMHTSLLSGERSVIVQGSGASLRQAPGAEGRPVAILKRGVVARLGACQCGYCRVSTRGHAGWVQARALWGLRRGERISGSCSGGSPVASEFGSFIQELPGLADYQSDTGGSS
jgi:SH3-like domain-containing protein